MRALTISGFILTLVALTASAADAQEPQRRRYLPDSSDEDWSFLKEAPKTDVWDPLKYIPFGRDGWFMTLSGEVRYRAEGLRIRATDQRPATIDDYLLQRYLTGADVHFGPHARFFTEVQSGLINGAVRTARPTDRNTIDTHQAFFEWQQTVRPRHRITAKVGRQELAIGSTRLISASPGLNVKRSFDGASLSYRAGSWAIVGVAARLVALSGGAFDDAWNSGQHFWGAAAGGRSPRFERGELGAYYLGTSRAEPTVYFQGSGAERRHTVGIKWSGTGSRFDLNYDAIYQWGTFGSAPIRAWGVATETGYRVPGVRWRPRVSVRTDFASGDRDPANPELDSFNPLFPGNSYSGAVGLFGPTNLTDLTAAVTFAPRSNLTIGFEAPSYWRTSTHDGVYATDLRLLVPPTLGEGKYVGTNPSVLAVWQPTRHVQLQGVITRFLSGAFLEDSFVSSGFGFYSGTVVYRF
jgi:alginate export protein